MQKKAKRVIVLCDGMADYPDSHNLTPMDEADKPLMDSLVTKSVCGLIQTVPFGVKPGSDVANLSVLGYDPVKDYTGRSPLEALSIGVDLKPDDVSYRMNFVTLDGNGDDHVMNDYSAGEISTAESAVLVEALKPVFKEIQLYAGVSYRHCAVKAHSLTGTEFTPPHDISGKKVLPYLPKGRYGELFTDLINRASAVLENHPINVERAKRGQKKANSVWFWGEGTSPSLENFSQKYGLKGAMISAVDLLKGIAIAAGMTVIDVEGATGTINTNFTGKAQAAITALETHDFVFIHLEAPDECGHQGDRDGKIKSISLIDKLILTPVYDYLVKSNSPFKIAVLPDHATPLSTRTHASDPIPYMIFDSEIKGKGAIAFNERALKDGTFLSQGKCLMELLSK